jgi:hypothetical protein
MGLLARVYGILTKITELRPESFFILRPCEAIYKYNMILPKNEIRVILILNQLIERDRNQLNNN